MSHSIIRIAKVKSKVNSTGIQKHIQRENENYENVDIDLEKTHMNYDLVNDDKINLNDEIEKKIAENYQGKRKIRTDAIKHVDGLITSDNEFFKDKSQDEIRAFFEHSKEFIENEYGKDNLLYATVHLDEKTPHMHFGIVPITQDGRLSAKEVIGNKKALTEFQDRFNEHVNDKGYDLERGEPKHKTKRKHVEVQRYKEKTKVYQKTFEHVEGNFKKLTSNLDKAVEHKRQIERDNQRLLDQMRELEEERDVERAKLDEIRAKQEKQEREYQKLIDVLKTPINVEYEYEYKKPSLFSEERYTTDNVIVSKELLDKIDKQAKVGQKIGKAYYELKNDLKVPQYQEKIKQQQAEINKKARAINKQNEIIKAEREAHEETKQKLSTNRHVLGLAKELFGAVKTCVGENIYHKVIDKIDSHMQSGKKEIARTLMTTDENDKNLFKEKDKKLERKLFQQELKQMQAKDKDKGFDRGFER